MKNKRKTVGIIIVVILVAFLAITMGSAYYEEYKHDNTVTVGFIYDNDESTPYSYSFYKAQEELHETYKGRIKTLMASNILEENMANQINKMASEGCDIIFTNNYANIRPMADKYPDIQFCQVSNDPYDPEEARPNYHTFKGEIYQGRYVSGVVAGMKLQQMINEHKIKPDEALVGFVAAYPYAEVISGYTAFFLGIRSVVPNALMKVRYTGIWSSYTMEKACAEELLDEGCVILSQHTDTTGPALACEERYSREVYFVSCNMDMTDLASYTCLTGVRINWTPYIIEAVKAVMENKKIEDVVEGNVHSLNDMSAGFDQNWVELTKVNEELMPDGWEKKVEETIEAIESGQCQVFYGNYTGVNPLDKNDTIDLREGFTENSDSSIPAFHYVLNDVIEVENP